MDIKKLTNKVSVFLGNSKRVTCKITNTQIHGSNVITMDEEIDCGVIIYYKGYRYRFNMINRSIQYFGFLGNCPVIYCDNKIIMFALDKIFLSSENVPIRDTMVLIEDNAKYGRWVHYNGVIYLESCSKERNVFYKLTMDEKYKKEEICKEEFETAVIKANGQREFMLNNLTSINNTYKK